MTETPIDSGYKMTLTFVRNVVGDIVPEIETATEHAHLFDAFFHIPQNTRLR